MGLTATHTFEEGSNGSAVPNSANGVVSVTGATYTTASIHGTLGVNFPSASGSIGYAIPAATCQMSFYGTVVTFGASNSTIASGRTTTSHQARVRINATGHFEISNASNTVVATSTATVAANDKYRCDVRMDNTAGTSVTVTVRIYLRTNIEGSTPDETIGPQTFTVTALNRVYLGTTTTPTWVHTFDTLRLYDDVTTWPTAFAGSTDFAASGTVAAVSAVHGDAGLGDVAGTTTYVMASDPTSSACMVLAKTLGGTSIQVGYSTDLTMATGVSFTTAAAPDSNDEYRVDITGLSANTKYAYKIYDTPTGGSRTAISSTNLMRTTPAAVGSTSFTVALGSCCKTATAQDDSAFANAVAWDPHFVLHIGDAYYNGSATNTLASQHRTLWETQIASVADWKTMLSSVPVIYTNSDHELNPDDTDTNTTNASSFNLFYKQTIPARLVDTGSTPVGKYRSWIVSGVRFILLDIRNTDRSAGAGTDNGSKTMLGATQKTWLKDQLVDGDGTPTHLKVMISDIPWSGTASLVNGTDKWWAYSTERQEIADYITLHAVNVDFLHGDSHRIAVDATHNAWGGFPVICGSPWSQDGGGAETNGFWDAEFHNSGTATSTYMRLTYEYPGDGTIKRTASGWDAMSDVERVAQVHTWDIGISGTVAATTAATGNVVRRTPASAAVAAIAATTGHVTQNLVVSGTIAVTTAVTGAVTEATHVSGTIAATTALTGIAVRHAPASGTVAVTSAVAGHVTENELVSGTVAVVSATQGILGSAIVSGTVQITSGASGATTTNAAAAGTLAAMAQTAGQVTLAAVLSGASHSHVALVGAITGGTTPPSAKAPLPGFNETAVIAGLHKAMEFGMANDPDARVYFHFSDRMPGVDTDDQGVPFAPAGGSSGAPTLDAVSVPCAIEFRDAGGQAVTFGQILPAEVVITLIDVDYQQIKGFSYLTATSDRYLYDYTEPVVALGPIDVWTIHAKAENER